MTKNKTFQVPSILSRISYLKDGGISIGFSTNELSDEDKLIVSKFHNQFGWLLFRANEIKDADIPTKDVSDSSKTPSQRLRAVLHVLWDQKHRNKYVDFNSFYVSQTERIIDKVKEKLDR